MAQGNKTALGAAIDILAVRSYSVKMLTNKLLSKGYDEEETAGALETLVKRGYLNDEELCMWLYRQYVEKGADSLRRIELKLLQKGFSSDLIRQCRAPEDQETELLAAQKVLRTRFSISSKNDPLRQARYLYGKGFSPETVREAMRGFVGGDFDCFDISEQ